MECAQEWTGRKDRHTTVVDGVIHRTDGTKTPARLTNFSDEGCRIEAVTDFRVGERLAIAIPRMGQIKVQIRWTVAGSAGAKFVIESDF